MNRTTNRTLNVYMFQVGLMSW